MTGTGMGAGTPAAVDFEVGTFDDLTLVVRAQEGDVRAFEALVRRYQRQFYRLAVRLLGNSSDAEDALQEAFVAAWRRLPGFRGEAAFSSWMYRIVTNRCLLLLRTRQPVTTLDELRDQPSPESASPEHAAETRDRATALQRALLNLPTDQGTCWILRELHGLGYEDIAIIVAAGPDAVRGRLHRARRTLAEVMAPWR
ncbi:MAG: RNA polymerase sigma factor [Pseudonocardiaceae bacterium]